MKRIVACIFMVSLLACGTAKAACTAAEMDAKSKAFVEAAVALAEKDAVRYADLAQQMQQELSELQQNVEGLDALCQFYDAWAAKMK